jgi:hypothetical protein
MGGGAAAHRAPGHESRRRPARARGDASVDRGSAASPGAAPVPRPVRGQRVRRRAGPRGSSSRGWPRRRRLASASSTAGSGSEGNARSGARALHAARSPSTGGSYSRRSRCSTTWSCTSSVTFASRTTRDASGSSSSDIARTGVSSASGSGSTGPSSWRSGLRSDPSGRRPSLGRNASTAVTAAASTQVTESPARRVPRPRTTSDGRRRTRPVQAAVIGSRSGLIAIAPTTRWSSRSSRRTLRSPRPRP